MKRRDVVGRRKRRRAKAALKNPAAVRPHKTLSGRKGTAHSKKVPSKKALGLRTIVVEAFPSVSHGGWWFPLRRT